MVLKTMRPTVQNRRTGQPLGQLMTRGPDRCRNLLFVALFVFSITLFLSAYLCPDNLCGSLHRRNPLSPSSSLNLRHVIHDSVGRSINSLSSNPFVAIDSSRNKLSFDQLMQDEGTLFDIHSNDVIVFLHIQKTGGTSFGRHLVRDLELDTPCVCKKGKKRCKCTRGPEEENRFWLFSRYSMGWRCGLHADWTELTNCVDNVMDESEGEIHKRRYFYITLLRDPVQRVLSEWRHVSRGATWKTARHWCGGRTPSSEELPSCYEGPDWKGVTLDDYLSCPHNLAMNRQTRMLADLALVGCYNRSVMSAQDRDLLLLASAKENLRKTSFFGICENQTASQYLFERTFRMNFKKPFLQLNMTRSSSAQEILDQKTLDRIRELNHLDLHIYSYAQQLLNERFNDVKRSDPEFDVHFARFTAESFEPDAADKKLIERIEKERRILFQGGNGTAITTADTSYRRIDSNSILMNEADMED